MDCKTARLLIALNDPSGRELPAEDIGMLDAHVSTCPDCAHAAEHEKQLDSWLGPAIRAVPTPIDLKARILCRLDMQQRPRIRRWVRPLILAASAAAAALVVCAWFAFGPYSKKPAPDIEAIKNRDNPSSPQEVERLFRSHYGIHVVAPKQFDYKYLVECKMEPHQKKQVPVLVFSRLIGGRTVFARAFIFSESDFDLSRVDEERPIYEGEYQVQTLSSSDRRFAYIVLFTSERIEDFFPDSGAGVAME